MADDPDRLWRLKLCYGKLTTSYKHLTLLADGRIVENRLSLDLTPGPAVMAMKVWSSSADDACEMMTDAANHSGFVLKGRIELYDTDPTQPPRAKPYGYDIKFTSYSER